MKERQIHFQLMFPTHHQTPKVAQPGKGALNLPPSAVTAQFAPVLGGRLLPVAAMGHNQLDLSTGQPCSQRVTIIAPIRNHPLRFLAGSARSGAGHRNRRQGGLQQGYFGRRGRVQVDSQRNTLAVDHHHPLCAFPPLGFSNTKPPFLAEAKLPSAKASLQSNCFSRSSVDKNLRQMSNQTSCSSHNWSRRQQVDGLGYLSGKSCQRAPVRRIHKIPSNTSRLGAQGRPPFLDLGNGGKSGSMCCHCLSVKSGLRRRWVIALPPPLLSHNFTSRATLRPRL